MRIAALAHVLAVAPLAAANPIDSLVTYWTLDGHTDDSAAVGSVVDDGTWFGTASYTTGVFGEPASAISLDGSNYVSVPGSIDIDGTGASISISAWFKVDTWNKNWQCLIAKGEGSRWRVARSGGDANQMSYAGGTADIHGGSVNDGNWHHIVAVSEAGVSTRMTIDGVTVATGGGPGLAGSTQPVLIGENPDATGRQWIGPIDDVGIFSIPLNNLQAKAIYDLAEEYAYDLGQANQILTAHTGGPGTLINVGDTDWQYAASDPGGTAFFVELGVDGSGMAGLSGPGIQSFTANHLVLPPGDPLQLSWEVGTSATELDIDQGVGDVLPLTSGGIGQITLDPGPTETTTYTLTATDANGSNSRPLTITVTDQPIIDFFTADLTVVEAGTPVSLEWNARNVTSLDLNGTPVTGTTGLVVQPAETTTYTLTATNTQGVTTAAVEVTVVVPGEPVISEFVADNYESLLDEDGDASDWIELTNPSATPAILDSYYLTDDPDQPTKWQIPYQILQPGDFLLVFASGKDRAEAGSELHANFSLRAGGEYLALVKLELGTPVILSEFNEFPQQFEDISYGLGPDGVTTGYMEAPTPDAANGTVFLDYVRDTAFFPNRGFYDTAQNIQITTNTVGATIRYTLDGSAPSETHGTIYSGPVNITTTTTLRAIAYKQDLIPTNVDAQTYIFLDDVIGQPDNPAGFPASWLSQAADYEMDPEVVTDPGYQSTIKDDLQAIPTISLSMDTDDLFGSAGIYSNPTGEGEAWERAGSMEIIDPQADSEHQVNCAVRMQGGVGRQARFLKHSFRLLFKRGYGPTKLDYPLFANATEDAEGATDRFDTIILRAGFNNTWHRAADTEEQQAQYLRDQFVHDSQLAMGHASPHGVFFHLYLNGLYWGVYNVVERPNADFASSYYGGDKEEWDALNSYPRNVVDGDPTAWLTAHSIATAGVADQTGYDALAQYVDIPNLIDYMLLNFYGGNRDWDDHNWYSARHRVPGAGYKFFSWDAERTLESIAGDNRTGVGQDQKPSRLFERLKQNPEFRLEFADHAHRHLFNNGTLTPVQTAARYQELANLIDRAIVGESARWGDSQQTVPYTRDGAWVTERDRLLNQYFPQRTTAVLGFLRGHNPALYPSLDAPVFSQHGGHISSATGVTISATAGTIYYTLDGSDPRLPGDALNPAAQTFAGTAPPTVTLVNSGSTWNYHDLGSNLGTAWRDPGYDDSGWASGPAELGYGDGGEATTVSYGGDDANKHITTYFRHQFTATDVSNFTGLTLEVMRDDGVLVYLNGNLILSNNMPGGTIDYLTTASGVVGGTDESTFFSFAVPTTHLAEGLNTLAVEIHQISTTSSDTSFDLRLKATQQFQGGGDALYLTETSQLRSRAWDGSQWSAINEALFIVDSALADDQNLVISEINYNPLPPTPQEEEAGLNERSDFEFLQLTNIGPTDIDLTNVRFTDGITFNFSDSLTGIILPAGESVVIVNNMTGFTTRYPLVPASIIAGVFDGNLNDGGEAVELRTTNDSILRSFTYDDELPWPVAPDGDGMSLVLVNPSGNPNHADPFSWRSSVAPGGTPDGSDATTFTGNTEDDADQDGVNALLEYAFGSLDFVPNDTVMPTGAAESFDDGSGAADHLTIDFRRNLAADDVIFTVEVSTDMVTWNSGPGHVELVHASHNGDGTETVTCRALAPMSAQTQQFMRVKVTLR